MTMSDDDPLMDEPMNIAPHPRDNHPRKCQAKRSDGVTPCRRYAAKGQHVCKKHGAASPQALRMAKQRLELAADRMSAKLIGLAENVDGKTPHYVQLSAVDSALNRVGVQAPTTVNVGIAPYEDILGSISGIAQISRAESRARRGITEPPAAIAAPDDRAVIDAEVVEPPEPPVGPQERPAWAQEPPERPGSGLMTQEQANEELRQMQRRRPGH